MSDQRTVSRCNHSCRSREPGEYTQLIPDTDELRLARAVLYLARQGMGKYATSAEDIRRYRDLAEDEALYALPVWSHAVAILDGQA